MTSQTRKIAERPGRIKQFDIQVGAENYLQLGIQVAVGPFTKWFRPEVIVTTETPVILFTLASREYAGLMWLAELFAKEILPSGVRINGNQITLDLREAPQLAPYPEVAQLSEGASRFQPDGNTGDRI